MSIAIIPGEEELGPQMRCPRCREWYPADTEFFYRRGDGFQSYCKACWNEYVAARLDLEKERARSRRRYLARRAGVAA